MLAKAGDELWDTTSARIKCKLRDSTISVPKFEDILKEIKYPKSIRDEQFFNFISRLEEQMIDSLKIYRTIAGVSYQSWASNLSDDRIQAEDPYMVEQFRYTLYTYWNSNWRAHKQSGTEMEIRHGIEGLLKLAFEMRLGAKHIYEAERDLFLPASPYTVTSDIITVMRLPRDWVKFLGTLKNEYIFASEQKMGEVITFACEAKCTVQAAASRQLTLSLCSAQHQRRALCLDDRPIYGATIVGNRLVMHSSEWVEDKIMIYPLEPQFDLETLPVFIECYVFLCNIADHIAEGVDEDFKRWESKDTKSKHQNALRAESNGIPWRQEFRPRPGQKSLHTSSYLDGGKNSSGTVQGEMVYIEKEDWDWELTGEDVDNERPSLVTESGQLVQANLQVLHDAYDAEPIPSTNDIRQWVQTVVYE